MDGGDGDDHVEDLFQGELVPDFAGVLGGGEERLAGGDYPGAVVFDQTGLTLIQMAVAFATRHPAVTAAIIGPRTMEHLDSYLAADGIELSTDVLDRIDEIVPPAVTINVADNMWNIGTTALEAAFRRR